MNYAIISVIFLFLGILFFFQPIDVFATYLGIWTDKHSYLQTDIVNIYGKVGKVFDDESIRIEIYDKAGVLEELQNITPLNDGTFSVFLNTEYYSKSGTYSIHAYYIDNSYGKNAFNFRTIEDFLAQCNYYNHNRCSEFQVSEYSESEYSESEYSESEYRESEYSESEYRESEYSKQDSYDKCMIKYNWHEYCTDNSNQDKESAHINSESKHVEKYSLKQIQPKNFKLPEIERHQFKLPEIERHQFKLPEIERHQFKLPEKKFSTLLQNQYSRDWYVPEYDPFGITGKSSNGFYGSDGISQFRDYYR